MSPFVAHALAQAPLPIDEERALARAKDRSPLARNELVCANLRNVVLHALRLGHRGGDLDEAVSAGIEGLIRAVDQFDPDRGTRLSTFAWKWIAHAMTPSRPLELVTVTSVPSCDTHLLADLPAELATVLGLRFGLLCEDGVGLTIDQVAQHVGISRWQVRDREARGLSHLRKGVARVVDRAPAREPIPRSSIGRAFDC